MIAVSGRADDAADTEGEVSMAVAVNFGATVCAEAVTIPARRLALATILRGVTNVSVVPSHSRIEPK